MISTGAAKVHLIRHGEVENPKKILYGRQPGWQLSGRGQEMAQTLGEWSKSLDPGALHVSPLQRAQETALPISLAHNLPISTDEKLIEAANVFEGRAFGVGDGALLHPRAWRHLWNPWKPSWGEPYVDQVNRMLAAVFAAREAAGGKDAICISHQLPIWILRSSIEGRHMVHDPRKRQCSLASVTTIHFDDQDMIAGISYSEPARHLLPMKK
ncbi:MAG: histidine phosphatase family protein [Candidatus Nanopelagicaceae bacterium]|nr:histidine phosphatase family protein [Candidatus Nanopelagicaceae bacterium]